LPHYGLSLQRGDHEERADLLSDQPLDVGDVFERLGEHWRVEAVEESELGRFEAWLVCSPLPEQLAD
jgi:hypothetical protein